MTNQNQHKENLEFLRPVKNYGNTVHLVDISPAIANGMKIERRIYFCVTAHKRIRVSSFLLDLGKFTLRQRKLLFIDSGNGNCTSFINFDSVIQFKKL